MKVMSPMRPLAVFIIFTSCGVAVDHNHAAKKPETATTAQEMQRPLQESQEHVVALTEEDPAPDSLRCIPAKDIIGPRYCNIVTLELAGSNDFDTADNHKSYYRRVDFATADKHIMEFRNETTGDLEREYFYLGNPSFTLSYGVRGNFSFSVVPGKNTIHYTKFGSVNEELVILESGSFVLTVQLAE